MPRFQSHESDRTFYCPDAAEGADVALDPVEAGHAVRVLRLGVGDAVTLFDGRGRFFDAAIASVAARSKGRSGTGGRESVSVRVGAGRESDAEPRARVVLLVGCLKGPKTDFLIQKCVELGVAELVYFAAERSVARPRLRADEVSCGAGVSPASPAWPLGETSQPLASETPAPQPAGQGLAPQLAAAGMDPRCLSIVVSACKQCGRASLMPVVVCGSLEAALARLPDDGLERIVYWEEASPSPNRDVSPAPGPAERRDVAPSDGQAFVVPASAGNPHFPMGGTAANSAKNATETDAVNAFPAKVGTTNVWPPEGGTKYWGRGSRGAYALIGPEGGLTAGEVARARGAGFVVRSLGRRILRAETAALAAAAILLHAAGELG